ncbi:MAG TPA: hypothetical protein VHL54_05915 [Actinomycetota bacterium]|nr:hypothetical protein [Actinomycetota bacterium]
MRGQSQPGGKGHLQVAQDADVAAWIAEGDRRRREGQTHIVAGWQAAGGLRPGIAQSEAADVLYTLTSPEVYLMLVKTAGWPPGDYESWLNRTLTAMILGEGGQD